MKSIKSQLLKVVIVIICINIIASIGSVLIQRQVISSFNQNETAVYNQSDQVIVKDSSISNQEVECDDDSCIVTVSEQFRIAVLIPYIFYMTLSLFSLIYGMFKVSQILKEITLFKQVTEDSLQSSNPNQINYQFLELEEVNSVLNQAIIASNDSKRLEKEVITFAMHDIKTPLQIIQGTADILKFDYPALKKLETIDKQVERINEIVESSLNPMILSKQEIGFLVEQLINEYILVYTQINFMFINNNQVMWIINTQSFRRILTNIIDNAIKNVDHRKLIEIVVEEHQILIRNSTNLITDCQFELLLANSSGQGLKIVDDYCIIHDIKPEVEVSEGWFNLYLKTLS